MHSDKAIEAIDFTKKFGSFTAVDHINFHVDRGEIFGFLGANGAGKTTAMKMLTGLLRPSSGQATVAGFDVWKQANKIKENIGYMSQKFSLYSDLTVLENIELFAGIYNMPRKRIREKSQTLIKELDISYFKDRLVATLPLGFKQKLAFSVAIFHEPGIVFLDEPTGGVDPITRRQFWEMIYNAAESGITPFVTTHYMDEAEYCNRVSIMVEGKIMALDTPANLKKEFASENMDGVFLKLARSRD